MAKRHCTIFLSVLVSNLCLLTGCSMRGPHSSLDPAGTQSRQLSHLWWTFFWVCVAVYGVTMTVILISTFRRRRPTVAAPGDAEIQPDARRDLAIRHTVVGAVTATAALLFVLLAADVLTARSVHSLASDETDPVVIKVTGHQWWWEVEYSDPVPSNIVSTGNEVHVPLGRVVKFEIRSTDVIHSFWIPNLHGKKDMIPGHDTSVWMQADRPGTYTGECAEFCGPQHAKMRFTVVVESPEQYANWLQAQRQSAAEPTTDQQRRGQQVFLTSTCVMCHTISGTNAMARVGPPLTHIASRPTLAAGAVPNTRGHLAGWIVDPQSIKPGTKMPQNNLPPADLQALLEYLSILK